jgi:Mg2+ and Co2+ transporters
VRVLDSIDRGEIDRLRTSNEFFWLDLLAPPAEQIEQLAELFDLHPVAVEDLLHFGQRPKIDDYPNCLHLVFYGVEDEEPVEVHLIVHGDALVTVRRGECSTLPDAARRVADVAPDREEYAVYRVLDALTDSFFPMLERIDDEIDELEDRVVERAREEDLQRIVALKRKLSGLRRRVGPQRDLLAGAGDFFERVPGFSADEAHDYYRDVYDHLLRIGDSIESYRDVLTGLLDVYLSAQSNRLNVVITRLTVLGTIFLPLTWVTGFFGQNFGWMVDNIASPEAFIGFGIGLEVVAVVVLLLWFRRAHLNH